MILTVTLNPSLDRTVEVLALEPGAVNRASGGRIDPGGKGVNVTRALLANGVASRAVLPVAGPEGDQLLALLTAEGVDVAVVPVRGRTRSNITIAEADGTVTKVNEPGTPLEPLELAEVLQVALAAARDGVDAVPADAWDDEPTPHGLPTAAGPAPAAPWVVLCGSLPPGAPEDYYATMTTALHDAGLRVAVDASGPALRAALGAGPDLVKPNHEELEEAVGHPLPTRGDVVVAAAGLLARGVGRVLVSLGAGGAVLVDADGVTLGSSTVLDPRSTVGAGDAFLAGYLAATAAGADATGALARALAWGAAAVRLPGSRMPHPADIDPSAVSLTPPGELPRQLAAPLGETPVSRP